MPEQKSISQIQETRHYHILLRGDDDCDHIFEKRSLKRICGRWTAKLDCTKCCLEIEQLISSENSIFCPPNSKVFPPKKIPSIGLRYWDE